MYERTPWIKAMFGVNGDQYSRGGRDCRPQKCDGKRTSLFLWTLLQQCSVSLETANPDKAIVCLFVSCTPYLWVLSSLEVKRIITVNHRSIIHVQRHKDK